MTPTSIRRVCRGVGLAVGILHAATGAVAMPQSALPVDDIVSRAVERAERQRDSGEGLAYRARIESRLEYLDGDGRVEETEWETYALYAVEGVLFEELVARDGEPLDADEIREEAERREEFREEVRERVEDGEHPEPERENSVEFDQEFVSRYRFSLVGEDTIDGHACWVVYLAPRGDDLPVRRRIDNALNNSTGYLWISQDDFGVARVEFEMARSVRFWGGILGTLRNARGRLEFARVADGLWMPEDVDIQIDLRILFSNIRRRIVRDFDGYTRTSISD